MFKLIGFLLMVGNMLAALYVYHATRDASLSMFILGWAIMLKLSLMED